MSLLKRLILRNFTIVTFLIIIFDYCYPQVINFTVLEKTRGSNLVVLGKCIDIEDEIYSIEYQSFPGKPCTGIRYGRYEVLEVWKGDFTEKTIKIDYKTTNEKYPPLGGCTIMYPADGKLYFQPERDEIVILFIEEGNSIYIGGQGKIPADKSTIGLYRDAVAKAVKLDNLKGDEKVNMIFDHLENDNKYISAGMRREFINIDLKKYSLKIAKLLYNENSSIKQLALFILNGTRDTSVVTFVIPLLKDTSVYVRRSAADVLRRIRDERTIPVLIDSYGDPDPIVRRNVIFALSNKYLDQLVKYREKAALLFCNAAKDTSIHVRGMGVYALATLSGQKATDCLWKALNDDSTVVRHAALGALSSRGIPSIVEPVGELLCYGGPEVLGFALSCINRLAENDYINPENHLHIIKRLRDIVNNDSLDLNRGRAAYALGKIKDPVFIKMLPDMLNDKDYSVRSSAIHFMGTSNNRKYIPILKRALIKEENKNIIHSIEFALEKLESK